jgi:hypothetical protein
MWSHEGIQFQAELASLMVSLWGCDKNFQRYFQKLCVYISML